MTEPSDTPKPRRASRAAKKAAPKAGAAAKAASKAAPGRKLAPVGSTRVAKAAAQPGVGTGPEHRHPSLGLAPVDMDAGFTAAAEVLRRDRTEIAARALQAVVAHDPEFRQRFTERGMSNLLHDAEMLIERLAMCLSSHDGRWLSEFAEWMSPILRRRGVAQADMAAICDAIRDAVGEKLGPDETAAAGRATDSAAEIFRKNGRLGGDPHKRNALLRWLYRGV